MRIMVNQEEPTPPLVLPSPLWACPRRGEGKRVG
jgi:hypothetical protein